MDTDQLIRSLAADNAHRAPRVGAVLTMALLVAAPLSILIFATFLGVRHDVMSAMHNPFFDMKFAVTLSLAIPAIIVSLHLSRPEALLRGWDCDVIQGFLYSKPSPEAGARELLQAQLEGLATPA